VLELTLSLLEKRALVVNEEGFASMFLKAYQDYDRQIKKMEAPPLSNNQGKLIKLQVLSPKTDNEETKITEENSFDILNLVREKIRTNNWNLFHSTKCKLSNQVLLLICIDFLKCFELNIFPSPRKVDYSSRSKQNMRRRHLMLWSVRFLQMIKVSEFRHECETKIKTDRAQVDLCYVKMAKLLLNQAENSFRNSLVEGEPQTIDLDVKEMIQWIKICEEDGDFALLSENLKKQASLETLPRNQILPSLHEDQEDSNPEQ
jgi:hypothetical protein